MTAAGWEVIPGAGIYIARLRATAVTGSVAGWLLRSIERDLVDDARRGRRARRARGELAIDNPTGDTARLAHHHRAPSTGCAAFAGPLVWAAVTPGSATT
jgi:hypothetical protein